MCVFVSHPMKIVTFLRKNDYSPKRVVDFPRERDTFRNKLMEIVDDFDEIKLQQQPQTLEIVEDAACESQKPGKSSDISNCFLIFLHLSMFFMVFFFPSCPFFSFSFFFFFPPLFFFLTVFSFFHFFICFFLLFFVLVPFSPLPLFFVQFFPFFPSFPCFFSF